LRDFCGRMFAVPASFLKKVVGVQTPGGLTPNIGRKKERWEI